MCLERDLELVFSEWLTEAQKERDKFKRGRHLAEHSAKQSDSLTLKKG